MGYYLSVPILIAAVVLQSSVLPFFRVESGQPELVLLIVLSWAVHSLWEEALFWAFLGGILQDLMSPVPTGTSIIALVLMIFAIKWLERGMYRFNIILLAGFVALATLLHHIIVVIVLALTGYTSNLQVVVTGYTIPTLALNVLGVFPVYFVLRRIQKRIPKPQSAWDVSSNR